MLNLVWRMPVTPPASEPAIIAASVAPQGL